MTLLQVVEEKARNYWVAEEERGRSKEFIRLILDFCFRIKLLTLWKLSTCLYILSNLQRLTLQIESTFLLSSVNRD